MIVLAIKLKKQPIKVWSLKDATVKLKYTFNNDLKQRKGGISHILETETKKLSNLFGIHFLKID